MLCLGLRLQPYFDTLNKFTMKKKLIIFLCWCAGFCNVSGQNFAISANKSNIMYVGLDNPVSLAVENTSNKEVVVKCSNGRIEKRYGEYYFKADKPGETEITLFKRENGHLKKIGRCYFRVKLIPHPTFKIGSGNSRAPIPEIRNQEYVRADMDNYFGYDVRFSIVSYTVNIMTGNPCQCVEIKCESNKINDEFKNVLSLLKPNDMLLFKNIVASGPDGIINLNPTIVTAY